MQRNNSNHLFTTRSSKVTPYSSTKHTEQPQSMQYYLWHNDLRQRSLVVVVGLSLVVDSRDDAQYLQSLLIERRVGHSNCSSFDFDVRLIIIVLLANLEDKMQLVDKTFEIIILVLICQLSYKGII
jgi:hypothetical protein